MDVILMQPGNGIKGESSVTGYTDWIQLLSLSHGFSQQITTDVSNRARTSGKPNIQDIACVKYMDMSSPKLYQSCLAADNLKTTTILLARNNAGSIVNIMTITLENTLISSVSMQANPGDMPTETFTLNFSQIKWEYTPQGVDLTMQGAVAATWSLLENTAK